MHRFSILLLFGILSIFGVKKVSAVVCYQCSGWNGESPLRYSTENTCDHRNNQCQATKWCVKITDAMNPSVSYSTFKSDCSEATQLQVTPTNLTNIVAGQCYSYQDGSTPVKKYTYCYCNDRDYCNSANLPTTILSTITVVLFSFYVL